MLITIFQQDIIEGNPAQNIQKAEMAIRAQSGSDLYVLPEMFSTGFHTDAIQVAEPMDGPTIKWLKLLSAEIGSAIATSLCITEEGKYYNRFCFVEPTGQITTYDKRHLFAYGNESKNYTPGTEKMIVEYKGVRFLLQTCYDLRFPVFSRNCKDYDAIIYVANWPTTRLNAWRTLLRARAIENQCYVIGANRVGSDLQCEYPGCSAIIHPYGHADEEGMMNMEQTLTSNIDINSMNAFRTKFPVLEDADKFELINN